MEQKVTDYINKSKSWKQEYQVIRNILVDAGLKETFKWYAPCYTYKDTNLIIIHGLKDAISISFMKGSLLKDPDKRLEAPGKNSQSTRYMKFRSVADIQDSISMINAYIKEAIEAEDKGLKVEFKRSKTLDLPDELIMKFQEFPELKSAFESLTPGRQRAYVIYFSAAKQSQTRINRIEKYEDYILDGKGMND